MRPALLLALPILTALVAAAAGCGTPCSRIAADRQAFLDRSASVDAPHVVAALPSTLADRWIAEQLHAPSVRFALPGPAGKAVPDVQIALTSVTLEPATAGRVGVRAVVTVALGRPLFTLTGHLALAPSVDVGAREVRVTLRGGDLRALHAAADPGAVDALVGALSSRLPPAARALLPRAELARQARGAVDAIAGAGLEALRDRLAAGNPRLATFGVHLPDLPIAAATAESVPGAVVVSIRTTLPVAVGTTAAGLRPRSDGVTVRFSGAAAAELANAAVAAGALPGRVDDRGKPSPTGRHAIGFSWSGGERPFALHAWCTTEPCTHVLIGATPTARLERGRLHLSADGVVEDIEGPPILELASWLGLASRPVHGAIDVADHAEVRVGDATVGLRVVDVRVTPSTVEATLAIGGVSPATKP